MKRIIQIGVLLSSLGLVSYAISQGYHQEPIRPVPDKPEITTKAKLGKALFTSKSLSRNQLVSCQSCHQPRRGYTQPISGKVQTSTLLNVSLNDQFFWNGRSKSLKSAIKESFYDVTMMNNDPSLFMETLARRPKMTAAFNSVYEDGLTETNLIDALEQYLITLVTPGAAFDKYLMGDKDAITPEAKKGYDLFKKLGCISCHQGVNVGGNIMQTYGIYKKPITNPTPYDLGHYNFSKDEADKFVFRVPSLRNIEVTAPYMHNGSQKTLKDAIIHMGHYQLNQDIDEKDALLIEEFLKALTGKWEVR